jgi:hypothetical protein
MKCPGNGAQCFDVDCQRGGCQGYDVRVEAVTVVHTVIRNRRGVRAEVGLVAGVDRPRAALDLFDGEPD